jgi:hypothetical protein
MVKFAFTLFSCSIMFIMCKGTETICAAKSWIHESTKAS